MLGREKNTLHGKNKRFRIRSHDVLHECIEQAVFELKSRAFQRFRSGTKGKTHLLVRFINVSNAADIPVTRDLLGVKRRKHKALPCNLHKIPMKAF